MIFYAILAGVLVGDVLWWHYAHRTLSRRWMRIAAGVFTTLQLAGLGALILGRMQILPGELPRPWASAVLAWHLLMLPPLLVWTFSAGIVALGRRLVGIARTTPAKSGGLTRREFFGTTAAFTPPLISIGAGIAGEWQLEDFRTRRIEVPLPGLPPALDGLTIAHVTDIHVGRFTRDAILGRIADTTNALNADIIALTGDLINDTLRAMPPALELVRALRAKHIIASCEGNHDLIDDARTFYREAERGGLPLLRNESATATIRGQRVQILGLPWQRGDAARSTETPALIARRDPSAWPILLAHHPHAFDYADGVPLTLAGHTHGGQLMLGPDLGIGSLMFRYCSGLYTRQDRALVVSNGVGNWFPVRIQAPAEIVHITLRCGGTS